MPRNFPSSEAIGQECQFITCQATIAAGSITSAQCSKGSIVNSGTPNVYAVALDTPWNELCGVISSYIQGTTTSARLRAVSVGQPMNGTLSLYFEDPATPGTPVATSGDLRITFSVRGDIRQTFPA